MQKVCLDRGETARCKTAGGADAAKENTHLAAILKPEIYLAFNSLSLSLSLSSGLFSLAIQLSLSSQ